MPEPAVPAKEISAPILAARKVLEQLRAENADLADEMAKILPAFAMRQKIDDADQLLDCARRGKEYLGSFKEQGAVRRRGFFSPRNYDALRRSLKPPLAEDPFLRACDAGRLDEVVRLHKEGGVDLAEVGHQAVLRAAKGGHLPVVEYLHQNNVSVSDLEVLVSVIRNGHPDGA